MTAQREWFEKDYYKVLGIPDAASDKEITRAYRKLAKQHHPDSGSGNEELFKEISAAYDVLGDGEKRKEYDEVRRLGPMAGAMGGSGFGGGGFSNFRVDDLGDLLGGIFGRGRAASTRSSSHRGDDIEAELHLSFEEAVDGVTTSVNLTSDAPCSTCGGTGAAPGTQPTVCSVCGGRGVQDENQGLFSFSQPCAACRGAGVRIEKPCPTCRGSGVERRPRQVKVRIPAGVEDGQRIRLKARGTPGRAGGPPGDLFVSVRVADHRLFGRRGRDLTITLPVTFTEATLGAEIKVPTLTTAVTLKVPAGTPTGRTFRVKGRGVPSAKTGDLLVTVEVAVPRKLSDEQREAVEALARATAESPRTDLGV